MKKLSTYEVNTKMRTEYFDNPVDAPDNFAVKRFVDFSELEPKLKEILSAITTSPYCSCSVCDVENKVIKNLKELLEE